MTSHPIARLLGLVPRVPKAFRVHGEHSTAMTGQGVANVADEVQVARCLDSCGGYATNQGGNVVLGFAQNTRDEVRLIGGDGQISGALAAESGMKQTTYVAFHHNTQACQLPSKDRDCSVSDSLTCSQGAAVGFPTTLSNSGVDNELSPTLGAYNNGTNGPSMCRNMQVRRLTPTECERLQGFPDGHTLIPWKNKPADQCPDGPRYKALGNSMAVNVMRWIGQRIASQIGGSANYLSLCSGIEAATTAWHDMGWTPKAFSEIEPFPSAVLKYHWPDVLNLGDMTKWQEWGDDFFASLDLLVGGTPCQAFSVAGLRESLSDERGNLTLTYAHIINHIDTIRESRGLNPATFLWENVPGVLNTKDNAFGCFLGALAGEDGPLEPPGGKWTDSGFVSGPQRTIAWRCLDAQYFGLAQRRKRVFVVGSAGTLRPEQVLFEFNGVRRDSPPSREARKESATTTGNRAAVSSGIAAWNESDVAGTLRSNGGDIGGGSESIMWPADVAPTLNAHFGAKQGLEDQHINGGGGLLRSFNDTNITLSK